MRVRSLVFSAVLLVPLVLSAQSDQGELRAEIRADLEASRPTLSREELDDMVEALAQEAEEQGTSEDYLAARRPRETGFESLQRSVPGMPSQEVWLALIALLILVSSLIWYRRRQLASE